MNIYTPPESQEPFIACDEFGELHAAIKTLAILIHEMTLDADVWELAGWQVLHVERLAETFRKGVRAAQGVRQTR